MARLREYRQKRKFTETPEPPGTSRARGGDRFVVQEHHARRLHYDFRLEIDGVLKSWAVPKGPSMNPADKRLAVQTEDHPLEYGSFQGTIPAGHYGAGQVKIWDEGHFSPEGSLSASEQLRRGELKFILDGKKLRGSFVLVKLRNSDPAKPQWLLIKHREESAQSADPPEATAARDSVGKSRRKSAAQAKSVKEQNRSRVLRAIKMPPGTRVAPMPTFIPPALASLIDKPFSDPDWLFEIKWDGVRAVARIRDGSVQLWSRSERDITGEYPELSDLPEHVDAREAWLDGEIVVLDRDGRSDFQKLQLRFGVRHPTAKLIEESPVVYYVFDLLYLDGHDLRNVPLIERKSLLRQIVRENQKVRYSDHVVEKGAELFAAAAQQRLEGIIAKKASSPYPKGRGQSWLKIKLDQELDAVVGGWTDPRGSREYFGALLLGLYEGGRLKYIGSVGSGFSVEGQQRLWPQLQNLRISKCPFAEEPATRERAYWVKPEIVARVRFGNWTGDRQLRQPRFLGFHEDHDPSDCTFETEMKPSPDDSASSKTNESERPPQTNSAQPRPKKARPTKSTRDTNDAKLEQELLRGTADEMFAEVDGRQLRFTNLNKVYFPDSGYRKRDLLAYYCWAASMILPFLKDRPLVLRRYPNGIAGTPFFQKEASKDTPEWVKTVAIASDSGRHKGGKVNYILANDRPTLLYLTNLGCIDHNPWSSRYNNQEHPDYAFFDLDPSEGASFSDVVKFGRLLFETLENFKFKAYAKTSGATGFHIYVPIQPNYTFEQVRLFVQAVADLVARDHPGVLTSQRTVSKRARGSIYMDAHQNSEGQSLASVYSVRAFPQGPISTPVATGELGSALTPERWNLKTIRERIANVGDLWGDFWEQPQRLESLFDHADIENQ